MAVGCGQVMGGSKKVECSDPSATTLVIEALQKSINSEARDYSDVFSTRTSGSNIRASINQLAMDLSRIRTTKDDPASTKNFCMGTLKVTIPVDMIQKANYTRDYHDELDVEEDAYQQDITLDANAISYEAEYSVQPTDDGEVIFVEMQNGGDLSTFLATVVVDSNQKSNIQKLKAQEGKAAAQAMIEAEKAEQAATSQAQSELASIAAEQAKVKAEMDYKRSEFNKLWARGSKEAQDSITYEQQEWVKYRDEVCVDEARSAEPARQEIVRMQCITRMLGERYYELKSYFDNY